MIDWKAKLTSRKFWAAICNFAGMLILFFKGTQETATQVTALIMAGAGVVAYIIGEGLIDAASAKGDGTVILPGVVSDDGDEEEEDEDE